MKTDSQTDDTSILLINRDGVIVDARENSRSSLGWDRGELVNKSMSELLEFGGDVLMERLHEMQNNSDAEFSVLTLLRKQDQSCVPTTAQVRRMPDLDCFTVAFDDLNNETSEAAQPASPTENQITKAPPAIAKELPPVRLADIQPPLPTASTSTPGFRNIFLNDTQRLSPKTHTDNFDTNPMPLAESPAAQIETADEQHRLEERVLTLTDQLQQLHGQLKSNLESENICQKKLRERETELRELELKKSAAEAILSDEQKLRESLEQELAQLKTTHAQAEADGATRQNEWLAKLQSNLTALHQSDLRLATELETRHTLRQTLQSLHQEFSSANNPT